MLNRVHGSDVAGLSAERALAAAENLEEGGIVDQESGKAGLRDAADDGSPGVDDAPKTSGDPEAPDAHHTDDARVVTEVDEITAGLLRLHAERMQVIAREQRTRDRFTSLHPEVAVAHVAALPGDVHDLAGLRAIGERLAAGVPAGA